MWKLINIAKMMLHRYEFAGAPHFRIFIHFKIERTFGKENAFPYLLYLWDIIYMLNCTGHMPHSWSNWLRVAFPLQYQYC